jgi:CubicO group peptidase (beta-lactamase class C family)
MRWILYCLACSTFGSISVAINTGTKVCPLLGAVFPAPTGLSTNVQFQAATKLFDTAMTNALITGISTNGPAPFNATTISIGMFSVSEKNLIYERHYTDSSVRNSQIGTQQVDANSIYRLGSIGKFLTVYLFLIRDGDQHFNDPITKYVPELAGLDNVGMESPNGITPNWSEITIGELASHMSGLGRNCK